MRIDPGGRQTLIAQLADMRFSAAADMHERYLKGTLPNGLAFGANGDILIAEDLTGQGHGTREVGPEPRVSVFVPLGS